MRWWLCCWLVVVGLAASGQQGVKNSLARIQAGKLTGNREALEKVLRKDSTHTAANIGLAMLYTARGWQTVPHQALTYWRTASASLAKASDKEKKKLTKLGLTPPVLIRLKSTIDSLGLLSCATEANYIHYLDLYFDSPLLPIAKAARDSLAYAEAEWENTYRAFSEFLRKYPASKQAPTAQAHYYKLHFAAFTKHKTREEFAAYAKAFPASPYAKEALWHYFQQATKSGKIETFEQFLRDFPKSRESGIAQNIITYLKIAKGSFSTLPDSLKPFYPLADWLPIHENGSWHCIDLKGKIQLSLPGMTLLESGLCEPLQQDYIATQQGIVHRNGKLIFDASSNALDLGFGFLLAKDSSIGTIVHKSGWVPPLPKTHQAKVIAGRYLALAHGQKWGVFSLSGLQLTPFSFEEVNEKLHWAFFKRAGKHWLIELNQLDAFLDGHVEPLVADEIKLFSDSLLWLRNGALEKAITAKGYEVVPLGRHAITLTEAGLITKENNKYSVSGWPGLSATYANMQQVSPWLYTTTIDGTQSLHYIPTKTTLPAADSIWFASPFALTRQGDTITFWVSPQKKFKAHRESNFQHRLVDSVHFLLLTSKKISTVLKADGFKKLFTRKNAMVEPISATLFQTNELGKVGVLNEKGVVLVPAEYDAIRLTGNLITLLQKGKFGFFNPKTKKIIKPNFESNFQPYGNQYLRVRQKGKWGFLDGNGKPSSHFLFDDIQHFTDSVAFVKTNEQLGLYEIHSRKWLDSLQEFSMVQPRVALARKREGYGILKDTRWLLPATFDEIALREWNGEIYFLCLTESKPTNATLYLYHFKGHLIKKWTTTHEAALEMLCDGY